MFFQQHARIVHFTLVITVSEAVGIITLLFLALTVADDRSYSSSTSDTSIVGKKTRTKPRLAGFDRLEDKAGMRRKPYVALNLFDGGEGDGNNRFWNEKWQERRNV